MYGKVENGDFIYAPNPAKHNGQTHYNPSAKVLLEMGYKPIIDTPPPESTDGKYYTSHYEEQGENIVKVWTETEPPAPVVVPYEYRVVARIREAYSVDDELAILRQKDTKPEEFEQYFAFVEKIKTEEKGGQDNGSND